MNVQLANTYNSAKNYKVASWWASPKFDGVRAVFIPEQGLFNRKKKPICGFLHLTEALQEICRVSKLSFIDGELIASGRSFQECQSIILKSDHAEKSLIQYHVFAVGGNFENTAAMLEAIPDLPQAGIFKVKSKAISNTFQAVDQTCTEFTEQGFEGVVLRHPDFPYFEGRNDYLLKFKFFKEADLRITRVIEGTGKLAGTLGSLEVEGEIDGLKVRSCVGTGLTNEDRKILWNDKELVGKVLTVKYQSITDKPDKEGFFSLRFPSVIGVKEDRDFSAETVCIKPANFETPSNVIYGKNGIVEVGFQVKFVDRPLRKLSYIPDKLTMAEWKTRLCKCRSIQEGVKLIADLKLTIPKIREFAKYLGVKLRGCKYLKAEIVRWLINASLGAWLRAKALQEVINARLFNNRRDKNPRCMRGSQSVVKKLLGLIGHFSQLRGRLPFRFGLSVCSRFGRYEL